MNLKHIIAPLTVLLMASIAAIVLMPSRIAVGISSQQRSAARDRQTLIDLENEWLNANGHWQAINGQETDVRK